nr:MarR family transcriptional regulator [Desulfovibrio ferrophilus]
MSGLVPAHGSVLACLYANQGPVPMKSIVEFTGRAKSTVTVMIRTLEKHGYISRVRSTDDGRVTLVALAPRGVEIQKDFDEISTQLLSTFYGIMPAEQRALLIDLLEQVESNFTN